MEQAVHAHMHLQSFIFPNKVNHSLMRSQEYTVPIKRWVLYLHNLFVKRQAYPVCKLILLQCPFSEEQHMARHPNHRKDFCNNSVSERSQSSITEHPALSMRILSDVWLKNVEPALSVCLCVSPQLKVHTSMAMTWKSSSSERQQLLKVQQGWLRPRYSVSSSHRPKWPLWRGVLL